jgi:hypothetical protein
VCVENSNLPSKEEEAWKGVRKRGRMKGRKEVYDEGRMDGREKASEEDKKDNKRKKGRYLLQFSLESGWIGHIYFARWAPLSWGDYLAYTVPFSLCPYPVVTLSSLIRIFAKI